ncbi:MAG: alkaline phosphatase family protein [Anaerolineaceae bacterium]|nr:alkaline phosphatase family protein [Anaerolineaceae bacterium]
MKKSFKLMVRLVLALALGAGAIFLALELMDNLYGYRSPLSENPPVPGQSFGEPMGERVVYVLIDGLRYDTSLKSEVMPFLNQLRNQGASAKMLSQTPSFSSPGYGSLLTGAWPYLSDAPAFNLEYENFYQLTQDNIFSSAKRHGLRTAVSGYYWFEKIIPADSLDIGFFTQEDDQKADRQVVEATIPWLESDNYDLIMIHLDQVDYAGHHEGGPQDERWDQAANRVDGLLAEIVAELDFSKDVLMISSDHGHIDQGGHGGHDPITLVEPFIMVGNRVLPGVYDDIFMVDVAPTLAALSGINLPATTQGRVLTEMINFSRSTLNELKIETARQQSQLLAAYATAIGQPLPEEATNADPNLAVLDYQNELEDLQQSKLNRERLIRFGIAGLVFLFLVLLLWRLKPIGWLNLVLGAILFSVLFHVSYITFGQKLYSYSTVISPTQLVLINGIFTIISLSITLLLLTFQNWIVMDLKQNFIKILDLGLFIMVVTSLPLIAHILWNGLFATWNLPDLALHYLALLSLIQIFFIGLGILFLSLATGIILINRRRRTA